MITNTISYSNGNNNSSFHYDWLLLYISYHNSNQALLEHAAKNFPLINWIKAYYTADKKLLAIVKEYEESLASYNLSGGSHANSTSPFVGNNTSNSGSSSSGSSPNKSLNGVDKLNASGLPDALDSNEFIFLYLPEIYKSSDIKDSLVNSVMTLVKNRQIKILDEEAYLMRKVAVAAAAAVQSSAHSLANGTASAAGSKTG